MTSASQITYRYVCDIARGGLGRVSLAFREEGDFVRLYAIKRLLPAYEGDTEMRSMFADEGRVAGLLRHPNVVSVIDVGEDEEGMYLVMDYIEGVPLSYLIKRLKKKGEALPIQHCIRIIRQVAEGLHAAHELKGTDGTHLSLVHRDVSPQNILIEPNGVVRVTDFGIAKALGRKSKTSTGLLKGKAGYIAPECLQFEDPDRRADLFSLGVVLYELVAGERLYGGKDLVKVARRILKEPPPDLALYRQDVPDELVALGFELVAKDRDLRPATAKEIIKRLDAILVDLLATEDAEDLEDYLTRHIDFGIVDSRRQMVEETRHNPITKLTPPPAETRHPVAGPAPDAPETRSGRWTSIGLGIGLLTVGVLAGVAVSSWNDTENTEVESMAAEADAPVEAPSETVEAPAETGAETGSEERPIDETPAAVQLVTTDTSDSTEAPDTERTERRVRRTKRPTMARQRSRMTEMSDRWGWDEVGMN